MKILMFGRGVIATEYGWALEKAGNTVEFYVRPGRAAQYGHSVNLEILDGRVTSKGTLIKEKWPITMREDLQEDHDYDLIILSVNHNQFDEAAAFLSSRISKTTLLIFNNLWVDPQTAASQLPKDQVVWGFPGGGGGFDAATLKGGFMKTIYMGTVIGSVRTTRYLSVRNLFREAGFSISEQKDFRSWLWLHFVLNAGLAAQALQVGGYSKLMSSSFHLKHSFLLMREMLPLLKAKGARLQPGVVLLLNLPAGMLGFIMQKFLGRASLPRLIMEQLAASGHASYALTSLYPRDVLADARKLGVPLPRLTALEAVFK
ncbi:ketopantoate reductase family protein [Paenibacillus eucommiae]|uniref:2-dehydropantoate 2-reductase n=1 Tax=Paenibacillus eucommiae TaxID=1355755 RepID=A0ABS4IQM5_9BACL|nr:2-dehydropantoate 2-reductase N-terminal domain-containing protein [Paenibacillus eucommiae]MBP1989877.1 2-dehydropantoate 2-reductase [Paenibacillus eucommiae]